MIAYFMAIIIAFFSRKIFLDELGAEFLGLTTTVNGLLGFLNLAELGVGLSIAYFLYKPLFDDDRQKINETISIMGYLYRNIGLLILFAGIVLSLFLPLIFKKAELPWGTIYYCYYAQLFCSLLGYFVNYKANTIFSADQRGYVVTGYFQASQFLSSLVQMGLALYTHSYAVFISVLLVFTVINSLILNIKFNQLYPWVNSNYKVGKKAIKQRPEIIKYVSRVFIHQIGGFINSSVMPIIMYGYASLTMVTLYSNYTLLNSKISSFINSALGGVGASVGNLIAEGDKIKTYNCYKELYSIQFFLVVFLTICLLWLNSSFISVWLGKSNVLPFVMVLLICMDFGLNLLRNTTEQYLNGFGLKADIWVPMCRIASLPLMALAGYLWDLNGILIVPVIIQLLLMHIWKPYYLYHSGFQISYSKYILLICENIIPFVIGGTVAVATMCWLGLPMIASNWTGFITEAAVFACVLALITVPISYCLSSGIRMFVKRCVVAINQRNK